MRRIFIYFVFLLFGVLPCFGDDTWTVEINILNSEKLMLLGLSFKIISPQGYLDIQHGLLPNQIGEQCIRSEGIPKAIPIGYESFPAPGFRLNFNIDGCDELNIDTTKNITFDKIDYECVTADIMSLMVSCKMVGKKSDGLIFLYYENKKFVGASTIKNMEINDYYLDLDPYIYYQNPTEKKLTINLNIKYRKIRSRECLEKG